MRYVIGLTGGIACGKSNVTDALERKGAYIVDADRISRELTAPGGAALSGIFELFGPEVFRKDELDRTKLGEKIYGDPAAREKLNGLMHPLILREMRARIDACKGVVILSAPLLYECGMETWCDEVWCLYIPQKLQLKRLMQRDHITGRMALEKVHAQMPAIQKARKADAVIDSRGSREETIEKALRLYRDTLDKLKDKR